MQFPFFAQKTLFSISKKKPGYIDYIMLHRNHRCIVW